MTRLIVVLAALAALSLATIWIVLLVMSNRFDDAEWELWDRRSGNRLGTSADRHLLEGWRDALLDRGLDDPADLVIGRT